jgi:hypothetical protein
LEKSRLADLVFIDETGVNIAMTRRFARSPQGARANAFCPLPFLINYPILWGGRHERLSSRAGNMPTPQEFVEYFFIWKSLNDAGASLRITNYLIRGTRGFSLISHGFKAESSRAKGY